MRGFVLAMLLAASMAAPEELPGGERWLPETIPDYIAVTIRSRACDSPRHAALLWMIEVHANVENLDKSNFYLLPYLWDRESGELMIFSSDLVSEERDAAHSIEFHFHPKLLDQVVVAVSINAKKHLIFASDFFEGQRCE